MIVHRRVYHAELDGESARGGMAAVQDLTKYLRRVLVLVAVQQVIRLSAGGLSSGGVGAEHAGVQLLVLLREGRLLVDLLVLEVRRQLELIVVDGLQSPSAMAGGRSSAAVINPPLPSA